jgi:6-phosphogluconolactonase (cycloisomerase 2 family)
MESAERGRRVRAAAARRARLRALLGPEALEERSLMTGITGGQGAALLAGLRAVGDFGAGLAATGPLARPLPIVDLSLGALLPIEPAIDAGLVGLAEGYLQGRANPQLEDLLAALRTPTSVPLGGLLLGTTADVSATAGGPGGPLAFRFDFRATTSGAIDLDLGAKATALGLEADASGSVGATFRFQFGLIIDPGLAVTVTTDAGTPATVGASLDLGGSSVGLRVPDPSAGGAPTAITAQLQQFAFNPTVGVVMAGPRGDGTLTLAELQGTPASELARLQPAGALDARLAVAAGLPGLGSLGAATVSVRSTDLFGGDAPDVAISVALGDAVQSRVLDILGRLDALGGAVDAVDALDRKLPLIDRSVNDLFRRPGAPGSGVGDFFRYRAVAQAYFDSGRAAGTSPTVQGLIDALTAHAQGLLGGDASGSLARGPFRLHGGLVPASREVVFRVAYDAGMALDPTPVSLGAGADDLGIDLDALLDLTARLRLALDFGLDLSGFLADPGAGIGADDVFVEVLDASAGARVGATDLDFGLRAGFLQAGVQGGHATLNATGVVNVAGPGGDRRLTLADLTAPGVDLGSLVGFSAPTTDADGRPLNNLDVVLPLQARLGGFETPRGDAAPRLVLSSPNVFAGPPTFAAENFDALLDFTSFGPEQVLGLVGSLGDFLDYYRRSPLLATPIPFADGTTIGDLLDLGTSFANRLQGGLQDVVTPTRAATVALAGTAGGLLAAGTYTLRYTWIGPGGVESAAGPASRSFTVTPGQVPRVALPALPAGSTAYRVYLTRQGGTEVRYAANVTASTVDLAVAAPTTPAAPPPTAPSPAFATVQALAALLRDHLGLAAPVEDIIRYDPVTRDLTFRLGWSDTFQTAPLPLRLDLDLGDLGGFTSSSTIVATADVDLALDFGVTLGANRPPEIAARLDDGPPQDGRLGAPATFVVRLGGGAPVTVTLPAAATADNTGLANPNDPADPTTLVGDLNAALAAAGLGGLVRARLEAGALRLDTRGTDLDVVPAAGGRLDADLAFTVALDGGTPLNVEVARAATLDNTRVANPADPDDPTTLIGDLNAALAEAGLGGLVRARLEGGIVRLAAPGRTVSAAMRVRSVSAAMDDPAVRRLGLPGDGRLPASSRFTLTLDGGAPVVVDLAAAATADNTRVANPADPADPTTLVGDLNATLAAAGLAGRVAVDALGDRLRFRAVGAGAASLRLQVDAADPLATLLGFDADRTARARSRPEVFVGTDTEIAADVTFEARDLAAGVRLGFLQLAVGAGGASGGLGVSLGFRDPDAPASDRVALSTLFAALNAGNSRAIVDAALTGSAELRLSGITANGFDVGALAGTPEIVVTLPDLVPAGDDLHLPADPLGRLPGDARFTVRLGGAAPVAVSVPQADTASNATFADLVADVNAALASAGLSGQVTARMGTGGAILLDGPTGVALELGGVAVVSFPDLGQLLDFRDLDFAQILAGLRTAFGALSSLADGGPGFALLNEPLPLVGLSVAQVADFGADLTARLDVLARNPVGAVQQLQAILVSALGLNPATSPVRLSYVPADRTFRIALDYRHDTGQSLPFNLDIEALAALVPDPAVGAALERVSRLVSVGASGELGLAAYAALGIELGFDLTDPLHPRPFLDVDGTALSLGIRVAGTGLDFEGAIGPLGIWVRGGSALLAGEGLAPNSYATFALGLADLRQDGRYEFGDAIGDYVDIQVQGRAQVDLPLFAPLETTPFGGANNRLQVGVNSLQGVLSGASGAVTIVTPDLGGMFDNLNVITLLDNPSLLLDGLDSGLKTLESGLRSEVLSTTFPVVGGGFAQAAGFFTDIRTGILDHIRALVGGRRTSDLIKDALFAALGPVLDPTYNPAGGATATRDDIAAEVDGVGQFIEFRFRIRGTALDLPVGSSFDIGLSNLGLDLDLEANATLNIHVGYDLYLGFGLSLEDGFYLLTQPKDYDGEPVVDAQGRPARELTLTAAAEIRRQDTSTSLVAQGTLGFLQVRADAIDGPIARLGGTFYVDLKDPGDDGRLTFGELRARPAFRQLVGAGFEAVAEVNLGLTAAITDGSGDAAKLPRIMTDFRLGWAFDTAGGLSGRAPTVAFEDVRLDLGSFLGEFLKPVIVDIKSYLDPIKPIVDVLTTRLPVISDLAGEDVTLITLAGLFGRSEVGTFIEAFNFIYGMATSVANLPGDELVLEFGDFRIESDLRSSRPRATLDPVDIQSKLDALPMSPQTRSVTTQLTRSADFTLDVPLLSSRAPQVIFGMLTGEVVDLFTFDMKKLDLAFTYRQVFPIVWPLSATLGGTIGATFRFAFGYDTAGYIRYRQTDDAAALLDGLYLRADGTPNITLSGSITAGAALDLSVAKGGVEGGVFATVDATLYDPNGDGKVRAGEIVDIVRVNPLYLFDIDGSLQFRLYAYVNAPGFDFQKQIIDPITLLSFSLSPPRDPQLATLKADGTLLLNIGPDAGRRLRGDIGDGAESYVVEHIGGAAGDESVRVRWLNADGTTRTNVFGVPLEQIYDNVARVEADGGAGDDRIVLGGVLSPASLRGGAGNDLLVGGLGANAIEGGAGDDALIGGPGADTLDGGAGTNVLIGAGGNDTLVVSGGFDAAFGGLPADRTPYAALATYLDRLASLGTAAGTNTLRGASATYYGLGAAQLLVGAGSAAFADIAAVELLGASGATTFDVSAWNRNDPVSLVGRQGTTGNTVVSAKDTNFTLSDGKLARGDGVSFTLQRVDGARLTGGAGANAFVLQGWTGTATLDGAGGDDTFQIAGTLAGLPGVVAIGGAGADSLVFTLNGPASGVAGDRRVTTAGVESVTFDNGSSTVATTWDLTGGVLSAGGRALLATAGASQTTITLGSGADAIVVGGIPNATAIHPGPGAANSVRVGDELNAVANLLARLDLATTGSTYDLTVDDVANPYGVENVANGFRAIGSLDPGVIQGLGMADAIRHAARTVEVRLGDGSNAFTIRGSAVPVTLRTRRGEDQILLFDAQGGLTLDAFSTDGNARLLVDRSGDTPFRTPTLGPTQIVGLGMPTITYGGFRGLEVRLGRGVNLLTMTNATGAALPQNVAIVGGPANDTFIVERPIGTSTRLTGGGGNDLAVVVIASPTLDRFPGLQLDVETLRVDHSAGSVPVAWSLKNGQVFAGTSTAPIVTAEGANRVEFRAGAAATDTLTVESTSPADQRATIQGSTLQLDLGQRVLQFQDFLAGDAATFPLNIRGLSDGREVAITPDGRFAYVAGRVGTTSDSIVSVFRVDPASGRLSYLQSIGRPGDLGNLNDFNDIVALAVSPDGRNVYAASSAGDAILRLARDPVTGLVQYVDRLRATGISGPRDLVFADDRNAYVASNGAGTIAHLRRDPATGAISVFSTAPASKVATLALSADGGLLHYLAAESTTTFNTFRRNTDPNSPDYGRLSGTATPLGDVNLPVVIDSDRTALAVSADGRHAYSLAKAGGVTRLRAFAVDPVTGLFTNRIGEVASTGPAARRIEEARSLVLSPDGRTLLVVGAGPVNDPNIVGVYDRDPASGELSWRQDFIQGAGGITQFAAIGTAAFSPDSQYFYVVSTGGSGTLVTFRRSPTTGSWGQQGGAINLGGTVGAGGYTDPPTVTFPDDGQFLYLSAPQGAQLSVYQRNPGTGVVATGPTSVGGLDSAVAVGNTYVYGVSNGQLFQYQRSGSTLVRVSNVAVGIGPPGSYRLTASPDGTRLFARPASAGGLVVVDVSGATPVLLPSIPSGTAAVATGQPALFAQFGAPAATTDGRVYLAPWRPLDQPEGTPVGIAVLRATAASGFRFEQYVLNGDAGPAIPDATAIATASYPGVAPPAGRLAYVVSPTRDSLTVLGGDAGSPVRFVAQWLQQGRVLDGQAITGLDGATAATVSADGRNLYVVATASADAGRITTFALDPTTGLVLRQLDTRLTPAGLAGVRSVAASADGRRVLVLGARYGALVAFNRDPATGLLFDDRTLLEGLNNLPTERFASLAFTAERFNPIGQPFPVHAYAAAPVEDGVVAWTVNGATGALTGGTIVRNGQTTPNGVISGLAGVGAVVLAPNDAHVYAAGTIEGAVVVFRRDFNTGALTYLQTLGGLPGVTALTTSADGRFVYATRSDGHVTPLQRVSDPFSAQFGRLATLPGAPAAPAVQGPAAVGATPTAISPDGQSLYAVRPDLGAVIVYARVEPSAGVPTGLVPVATLANGGPVAGLGGAAAVSVSPDGRHVVVVGAADDSVVVLSRVTTPGPDLGKLTFVERQRNGVAGVVGLAGASSVVFSRDGRYVFVGGGLDDSVAVFRRDADPASPTAGRLVFVQRMLNGAGGTAGLDAVNALVLGPRGQLYATSNGGSGLRGGIARFGVDLNAPEPLSYTVNHAGIDASFAVLLGDGNNRIDLRGTTAGIPVTVQTGTGADVLNVTALMPSATTTVGLGAGDNVADIRSTTAAAPIVVTTGNGADRVRFWQVGAGSASSLATGGGDDIVQVFGPGLGSDLTVAGGDPTTAPGDLIRFDPNDLGLDLAVSNLNPDGTPRVSSGATPNRLKVQGFGTLVHTQFERGELVGFQVERPAATILSAPTIAEGQALTLSAAADQPFNYATGRPREAAYAWDLNGDGRFDDAAGPNPTIAWADLVALGLNNGDAAPGRAYPIRLRVIDDVGLAAESAATIRVTETPPAVSISGPSSVHAQAVYTLNLSASDPGADPVTRWEINWGDGVFVALAGNPATATRVFGTPGVRTIQARVVQNGSQVTSAANAVTVNVTVFNRPPVAAPGGPYALAEGQALTLDGSASSDPDGNPLTYSWYLGTAVPTGAPAALGAKPSLSWAQLAALGSWADGPAVVPVTLVVSDGPFQATATTTLTIADTPPSLQLAGPAEVVEGSTYTLELGATDPGRDTITSWRIHWGDGSAVQVVPAGVTRVDHVYADGPNAFPIQVWAVDEDGVHAAAEAPTVIVRNVAPTLTLSGPATTVVGTAYALALSSNDPGADTIARWRINWGDGQGVREYAGNPASVAYAYGTPGSFVVSARAVDEDGTWLASNTVLVRAITALPRDVTSNLDAAAIDEGGTVGLRGGFVVDGPPAPHTLAIDWGDGTGEQQIALAPGVLSFGDDGSITHRYADNPAGQPEGGYVVRVRILTATGASVAAPDRSVLVRNVGPMPRIDGPATGREGEDLRFLASATDASPIDQDAGFAFTWTVSRGGVAIARGSGPSFTWRPDDDGVYVVILNAVDKDGGIGLVEVRAEVANVAPTAEIAGPAAGLEGGSLTFRSIAADASAADAAAGLAYAWTVLRSRSGGPFLPYATASTSDLGLDPDDDGVYLVRLVVTDKDGASSPAAERQVAVANVAPTAGIAGPAGGVEGTALTFDAVASDPSAADRAAGFVYGWAVTRSRDGGLTYQPYATATGARLVVAPDDDGLYAVRLTVSDKDGGTAWAERPVRVDNLPPSARIEGPAEGLEGAPLTLLGIGADASPADAAAGLAYAWTVLRSRSGGPFVPYAAASTRDLTLAPDDDGAYLVRLVVTDKDGASSPGAERQVSVGSVAPRATIEDLGGTGLVRRFRFGASDPSAADRAAGLTYAITWGDGTTETLAGGEAIERTRTFAREGTFTVRVLVTDKDGASGEAALTVTVLASRAGYDYEPDPLDPTRTALVVRGTAGADDILINPGGGSNRLKVKVNAEEWVLPEPTGRIIVHGLAGNDDIKVAGGIRLRTMLLGGAGDDSLRAGGGPGVLVGGDGSDSLVGGNDRDVLIGGEGGDQLDGGPGDDVLIAGSTVHDEALVDLARILETWGQVGRTYEQRIADLAPRLNDQTVFDDAARDTLRGTSGRNTFFGNPDADSFPDRKSNEVIVTTRRRRSRP